MPVSGQRYMCIRPHVGCEDEEGNVLETDGSRAKGNTRRRNGDCRMRHKRPRGDQ